MSNEVPDLIHEIPKDCFIGIFCSYCVRSVIIFSYLLSKGYTHVKNISGGYDALMDAFKPGKLYRHIQSKNQPEQ